MSRISLSLRPGARARQRQALLDQAEQFVHAFYAELNQNDFQALASRIADPFIEHRGEDGPEGFPVRRADLIAGLSRTIATLPDRQVEVRQVWRVIGEARPTLLVYGIIHGHGSYAGLPDSGTSDVNIGFVSVFILNAAATQLEEHYEALEMGKTIQKLGFLVVDGRPLPREEAQA